MSDPLHLGQVGSMDAVLNFLPHSKHSTLNLLSLFMLPPKPKLIWIIIKHRNLNGWGGFQLNYRNPQRYQYSNIYIFKFDTLEGRIIPINIYLPFRNRKGISPCLDNV